MKETPPWPSHHCHRKRRRQQPRPTSWAMVVLLVVIVSCFTLGGAHKPGRRPRKKAREGVIPHTCRRNATYTTTTVSTTNTTSRTRTSSITTTTTTAASFHYHYSDDMLVKVTMAASIDDFDPIQTLSFCSGCPDPRTEGSLGT